MGRGLLLLGRVGCGSWFLGTITGIAMRWSPWPEWGLVAGVFVALAASFLFFVVILVIALIGRKVADTTEPKRPPP
jgi:hypothetical protein